MTATVYGIPAGLDSTVSSNVVLREGVFTEHCETSKFPSRLVAVTRVQQDLPAESAASIPGFAEWRFVVPTIWLGCSTACAWARGGAIAAMPARIPMTAT